MTRIGLIALGSRGDVEPMAALALELQQTGYRVRLLIGTDFVDRLVEMGLDVVPYEVEYQQHHHSDVFQRLVKAADDLDAVKRVIGDMEERDPGGFNRAILSFSETVDVIASSIAHLTCAAVAERLGIRYMSIYHYPSAGVTTDNNGRPKLSPVALPGKLDGHNRLRCELLGLDPDTWTDLTDKCADTFSVHVYSPSVGAHLDEWPAHFHTTGFCFLDEKIDDGWRPPRDLANFVCDGEPPVVIGFGSMTTPDLDRLEDAVVEAVERTGRRTVLLSGWSGLGESKPLPGNVFCTRYAKYPWLCSRAAAAVHHGGAGSVAASLRAGLPTVVVPFCLDQFFWGRRVHELGAGPKPIHCLELTGESLSAAIEAATMDESMRRNAQQLAGRIARDQGTRRTAELIDGFVRSM